MALEDKTTDSFRARLDTEKTINTEKPNARPKACVTTEAREVTEQNGHQNLPGMTVKIAKPIPKTTNNIL